MPYLTFPAFQATRTPCADLSKLAMTDEPMSGFTYEGGCYIQNIVAGSASGLPTHYLIIERSEWMSDDLDQLERILWANWYLHEAGTDVVLRKDDSTIDDFVIGWCAMQGRGMTPDGDLFGVLFSGKDEWPIAEVETVLRDWRDEQWRLRWSIDSTTQDREGNVIYRASVYVPDPDGRDLAEQDFYSEADAKAWLDENYPNVMEA